jgi:hypothetical protein
VAGLEDFGYAFTTSAHSIPINGQVPFDSFVNNPSTTNISLVAGTVTVASSGFYQVTYGVSTQGSGTSFTLVPTPPGTSFPQYVILGEQNQMISLTVIVHLTGSLSYTLNLVNTSGKSETILGNGTSPSAYMTILKLQ